MHYNIEGNKHVIFIFFIQLHELIATQTHVSRMFQHFIFVQAKLIKVKTNSKN